MHQYKTTLSSIEELEKLYTALNWNQIGLTRDELNQMVAGSWYSIFVYKEANLIGTGRIISDGIITGLICGVGVLPLYQGQGVGKKIIEKLVNECEKNRIFPQLMCDKSLISFYESIGFKEFTVGMNYSIKR
ncbi:GNAT family N-acetyltransferase [Vagococcus carniphilus]|uniref:GNAT family N-acetyltransferase n=1 Tax=Vagococcus carniphilus TaxID=218144 RepID=A0A430B7Q2_9ENTE|nr:GNAT family N-acetyltransferase [Vagococcus carniphilus]QNN74346.1 GNAT family N-acetyltransferase [Vagococcus carniphilus]RSU16350.1 GNAT family N-acetyltransferase [Vagococcus carniphilus]